MVLLLVCREITGEYLVMERVLRRSAQKHYVVLKFKETGTTEDKPRCDRPRNIRTDSSIQRVAASVADSPKTSKRR